MPRRLPGARWTAWAALVVVAALGAVLLGQARHPASGRVIAPVMGVGGAEWLERPEREREEAPTRAIAALKLQPGQTVADIGTGSGYYALRMARVVGPAGKVYATDIQPGMLDLLRINVGQGQARQRGAGARHAE